MSEQAEGQRTENNKISRRKLFKIGATVAGTAVAERILPASPASAETPTPTKTLTPTRTPSISELQTQTANLYAEQTVQAGQLKAAEEYKKAAATNTAQAGEIERALDNRPSTSTPTPTKPPSTSTPTPTSTWTAEQIELKRKGGLLPPEPTATEHPAERAIPTPPGRPDSSGDSFGGTIFGLGALAALVTTGLFIGIRELIKSGIFGHFKKGWKEAGGTATGEGEGTARGTTAAAAGTGTVIEGKVVSSEDVTPPSAGS